MMPSPVLTATIHHIIPAVMPPFSSILPAMTHIIHPVVPPILHIVPAILPPFTAIFPALTHIIHAVIPPIMHVVKLVVPVVAIPSHLESLCEICSCQKKTY